MNLREDVPEHGRQGLGHPAQELNHVVIVSSAKVVSWSSACDSTLPLPSPVSTDKSYDGIAIHGPRVGLELRAGSHRLVLRFRRPLSLRFSEAVDSVALNILDACAGRGA